MSSIKQELLPVVEKTEGVCRDTPQEMPEPGDKPAEMSTPSLDALREAIPRSCFDRSTLGSFAYLLRDVIYAALLVYLAVKIDFIPVRSVRVAAWIIYGVLQGFVGTGLWIIGHECGHAAFSPSAIINDTTGWLVHSSLMVPYFSWKITHARHHRYTGHMEKDVVFVPRLHQEGKSPSRFAHLSHLAEDTPAYTLLHLLGHQLMGWQIYLLFNITAGKNSLPKNGNRRQLLPNASHFDPSKGALCTVDRNFGFVGRHFFHEIIDYHVVHHLFPKIPFYKAEEATRAIMPLLGPLYRQEKQRSFLGSLYSTYRACDSAADADGSGVVQWVLSKQ
ncbi:Oleate delta-12 desaturase [Lasiodiplodia theobromae]|uniref:Oleate delta-12 desaturase n=1 Tax=Lasiodiplodia theobromae TaxID=45133 RepID=UPI0015C371AB|nr:Oleate delta-12 desaturase [Lasiodiplodia theobromae]KAF4544382.1 Oleate delta-12 desaturase [Lasiodiplodia theobromae]